MTYSDCIDSLTNQPIDMPRLDETVRVYQDPASEYYLIGDVVAYDPETETYEVLYNDRRGYSTIIAVSAELVVQEIEFTEQ